MRERGLQLLDGKFSESCWAANTAILQSRVRGHLSGLHSVMKKRYSAMKNILLAPSASRPTQFFLHSGGRPYVFQQLTRAKVVSDRARACELVGSLTSSALRWKMLPYPNMMTGSDERYSPART